MRGQLSLNYIIMNLYIYLQVLSKSNSRKYIDIIKKTQLYSNYHGICHFTPSPKLHIVYGDNNIIYFFQNQHEIPLQSVFCHTYD